MPAASSRRTHESTVPCRPSLTRQTTSCPLSRAMLKARSPPQCSQTLPRARSSTPRCSRRKTRTCGRALWHFSIWKCVRSAHRSIHLKSLQTRCRPHLSQHSSSCGHPFLPCCHGCEQYRSKRMRFAPALHLPAAFGDAEEAPITKPLGVAS